MTSFAINFDYRCPFARNANEHVLAGLEDGAPWDVRFLAFSLSAMHTPEDAPPVFGDLARRPELLALAAGVVVRERFPEKFRTAHRLLFAARHDNGEDLREESVVRTALERAGVDADAVLAQCALTWPYEMIQAEHESAVAEHDTFGVPTFTSGDAAVFVRLMDRPGENTARARRVVEQVLHLIAEEPTLNEFKHTRLTR